MQRLEFDMETTLPPERVLAGLTDFSERRPEIWPNLSAKYYEVYSVGDTSADVREGTDGINIWARERYDWSTPGIVGWTVQESNFCTPGSGVEVSVTPSGTGSNLHVKWWREGTTFKGRMITGIIRLTRGKPLRSTIDGGLRRLASAS